MKPSTKINSLVKAYFRTSAPSTSRMARNATTALCEGKDKVARVYSTVIEAKGTPCGRAVSVQNATGEAIRKHALVDPFGGYWILKDKLAEVQAAFDEGQDKLAAVREEILNDYPAFRKRLQKRLREIEVKGIKLSTEFTIPQPTAIAEAYTMSLVFTGGEKALTNSALRGVASEAANRAIAESEAAHQEALRQAHGGPLLDLFRLLTKSKDKGGFIAMVREAKRLHAGQFDKLADEMQRLRNLNVLDLPEINEVLDALTPAAMAKDSGANLTGEQRAEIAKTAETAAEKAKAVLNDLGL